jgi:serine phosphatase RsbU (regulator of sigma subunit)
MNEVLRTYAPAGCAELHARLVEAVEEFSDTDEEDDITMLVLEYQP